MHARALSIGRAKDTLTLTDEHGPSPHPRVFASHGLSNLVTASGRIKAPSRQPQAPHFLEEIPVFRRYTPLEELHNIWCHGWHKINTHWGLPHDARLTPVMTFSIDYILIPFMAKARRIQLMTPDEIRQLRRGLKMSQEEFARELGISFATVNRWENNKTAPSRLAQRLLDQVRKRQNRFQASS